MSLRYTKFFNSRILKFLVYLSFFQSDLGFESNKFLVDILPLGSGSVDPHIFTDPDLGSQNLPDPHPKH